MKVKSGFLLLAIGLGLQGCASFEGGEEVTEAVEEALEEKKIAVEVPKFTVLKTPYAAVRPDRAADVAERWLQTKKLNLNRDIENGDGISLREILKGFNAAGVNISTTLPVDRYYYRGFPINNGTSADVALKILTEQLGLDYIARIGKGSTPYVSIIEMGGSDYRLSVPDVVAAMSIVSSNDEQSQSGGGGQSSGSQSGSSGVEGTNSSGNGGTSQGSSGNTSNAGGQGTYLYYQSSFWEKLEEELKGMMKVMVPVEENRLSVRGPGVENVMMGGGENVQQASSNSSELFREVVVGRVDINSVTGHITVIAPRHIRERVIRYLKELDDELNTRMIVEAKVVSVSRTIEQSRGVDISGFKSFASEKYGLNVSNNVLGNITIADATEDGFFGLGSDNAITQSLIGITRADKAFAAFFAYLETKGTTQSVSDLRGSGRSGRPIILSTRVNDPTLSSSTSTVTTDSGSTSGGSSSEIVNNYTGTSAKITPQYDPDRGVVQNLVDINLRLDAGEKVVDEPIVAGDNIQFRTLDLKRVAEVKLQTETVSRSGEVILAGGIRTLQQVDSDGGVMGLKDSFAGDLFGKKSRRVVVTDYFVLLSVSAFNYREEF